MNLLNPGFLVQAISLTVIRSRVFKQVRLITMCNHYVAFFVLCYCLTFEQCHLIVTQLVIQLVKRLQMLLTVE